MDNTLEIIWKMFREGGIKQIKIDSCSTDNEPCKVWVTHHDNLVNKVTCDKWDKNMKGCTTCEYE